MKHGMVDYKSKYAKEEKKDVFAESEDEIYCPPTGAASVEGLPPRRAYFEIIMGKEKDKVIFQEHLDLTQNYFDIGRLTRTSKDCKFKEAPFLKKSDLYIEKSKKHQFIAIG